MNDQHQTSRARQQKNTTCFPSHKDLSNVLLRYVGDVGCPFVFIKFVLTEGDITHILIEPIPTQRRNAADAHPARPVSPPTPSKHCLLGAAVPSARYLHNPPATSAGTTTCLPPLAVSTMSSTTAAFVVGVVSAPLTTAPARRAAATNAPPADRPTPRQRPLLRATLLPDAPTGGSESASVGVPAPPAAAVAAVPSPSAVAAEAVATTPAGGDAAAAAIDTPPPVEKKKKKARKSRRHTRPRADGSPRVPLSTFSPGQRLDGVVTNLVKHGAYVDVGATTDGLVHLRDMSVEFVHEPEDILASGDAVEVYVKYAEEVTGRLALSLLRPRPSAASPLPQAARGRTRLEDLVVGSRICGTVRRVSNFGAYVDVGAAVDGFVHVSQLYGRRPRWTLEELRLGQDLWVVVDDVDVSRKAIKLRARGRSSYNREQPLTAHALSDADERAAEAAYLAGFGRPSRAGGGGADADPRQAVARPGEARGQADDGSSTTPRGASAALPVATDPLSRFESNFGSDVA